MRDDERRLGEARRDQKMRKALKGDLIRSRIGGAIRLAEKEKSTSTESRFYVLENSGSKKAV